MLVRVRHEFNNRAVKFRPPYFYRIKTMFEIIKESFFATATQAVTLIVPILVIYISLNIIASIILGRR